MATSTKSRRKAAEPIAEAVEAKVSAKPARKTAVKTPAAKTAVNEVVSEPKPVRKAAAKKPALKKAKKAAAASEVVEAAAPVEPAAKPAPKKKAVAPRKAKQPEVEVVVVVVAEAAPAAKPPARKKPAARKTKVVPVAEVPAPPPAYSVLTLDQGLRRGLLLQAGTDAPARLTLDAPEQPLEQQLQGLLRIAADAGHELRVADEVWLQLAPGRDAEARVLRLETAYPDGQGLAALLQAPLHGFQWEAALFAVCAGRALLADDLGLSQRGPALAAWRLASLQFGLGQGLLVAPAERHADWQTEAQRLLGGWPAGLRLLAPAELRGDEAADCLIVDAVQDLTELDPLRAVQAPWLWLLADRELLGEPQLDPLVDWLDAQRRGPLAQLRALGADASKRQQREALQTVMLSRRKRDLGQALPLSLEQPLWVQAEGVRPDAQALEQSRQLLQRWQRLGYLAHAEQLQLLRAVARLREAAVGPQACTAKLQAIVALLPQIMPALTQKLVIAVQQDATAVALAQGLAELGLAVASLRRGQVPAQRAAELAQWQGEQGQVLLVVDAACPGLDLSAGGVALLLHGDLPWNPAQRAQRVARVAGSSRGLLAWQLLVPGSLDAGLLAAHEGQAALPAAQLDFESTAQPFLEGAALQRFMAALQLALAALA